MREGPVARARQAAWGASLAFHRTEQDVVLDEGVEELFTYRADGTCALSSLAEHVHMAVFREGGETWEIRDVAGAFMASMDPAKTSLDLGEHGVESR